MILSISTLLAARRNTKAAGICMLALVLSACAPELTATYYSVPPGAYLYSSNGMLYGRTPVTLKYPLSNQDIESGSIRIRTPTSRWVSGATTQGETRVVNFDGYYPSITFTILRPENYPNLSADIASGNEHERKLAETQQQLLDAGTSLMYGPKQSSQDNNQRNNMTCYPNGSGGFNCQ